MRKNNFEHEGKLSYAYIVSIAALVCIPLYRAFMPIEITSFAVQLVPVIALILFAVDRRFRLVKSNATTVIIVLLSLFVTFFEALSDSPDFLKLGLFYTLCMSFAFGGVLRLHEYGKFFRLVIYFSLLPLLFTSYQVLSNGFNYNNYLQYGAEYGKISYVVTSTFSILALLVMRYTGLSPLIKTVLIVFFILFSIVSAARLALLFIVVYLLHWLFISFFGESKKGGIVKKIILGMFVLALSGAVVLGLGSFEYYTDGALARFMDLFEGGQSITARSLAISDALDLVASDPIFGYGLGSSETLLFLRYPHNLIVQASLESGVIVALLCLYLIVLAFATSLNVIGREILQSRAIVSSSLALAILFLIITVLKSGDWLEAQLLFCFLGIWFTLNRHRKISTPEEGVADTSLRRRRKQLTPD